KFLPEETRPTLVAPKGSPLPTAVTDEGDKAAVQPRIHMAESKYLGNVYALILLLVIVITNVPLRGLWSVLIIVTLVLLSIIFAQAGIWELIFHRSRLLDVHINMGGYIAISSALFIVWLFNFWFFDRQIYMIFTPGQVRVHLEIGGGETVYDTTGMVFQKQ